MELIWFLSVLATVSSFELTVFNLNTLGASYFEDGPTDDQEYDITAIKNDYITFLEQNYANQALLGLFKIFPTAQMIGLMNPAKKKLERFQGICQHLKNTVPDVVFLQEVWYKKDYDFLKDCLKDYGYHFSEFDPMCGSNPVSYFFFKYLMFIFYPHWGKNPQFIQKFTF